MDRITCVIVVYHCKVCLTFMLRVLIFDSLLKDYMITRNSSGDEIANVNFLCDDIVHALKIQ